MGLGQYASGDARLRTAAEIEASISRRLGFLYCPERAQGVCREILSLVSRRQRSPAPRREPWDETDALLITYGDSILDEGLPPLRALKNFLQRRVGGLVTFLHLLPFYPYSSDDGFAVKDFRAVNPDLGDWSDVKALADSYRLVFDAVINHVSASSLYMDGYASGDASYDNFFIPRVDGADTSGVLRTRNLPLFHPFQTPSGAVHLWTTFGPDQPDLNYANPRVLVEILDVLLFYAERGAKVVRLDAIPYLWKTPGTSCAHLPQTHEVIRLIRDVYDLAYPEVLLLTETNVPHRENVSYFGDRGDEAQISYNFTLPPLVLHALVTENSATLTRWARTIEPVSSRATYLNITATHDGIGMRPTEGILPEQERRRLVDIACARGGRMTGKTNPDGSVSPYELNINYFDAVSDPHAAEPLELQVKRFMVSQAIALAFIGIPGIYIHSLLGSRSDAEAVKATGIARRINRAKLATAELEHELSSAQSMRSLVFAQYARMLSIRRGEKAFHPNAAQEVIDLGEAVFALKRTPPDGPPVLALNNVTSHSVTVNTREDGAYMDLLGGARLSRQVTLEPYQVMWLRRS